MKKINEMFNACIKGQIEELEQMLPGEEKSRAIEDLVKMYKMKLEEERNDNEFIIQADTLGENVTNQRLRVCIDVASIIVPIVFYGTWMRKGFRFEETGTFTSRTFMNLINRFKPTK